MAVTPVTLRYPYKKLEKSDDYLLIDVIKYIPPGIDTQPGTFFATTSDQTYSNLDTGGKRNIDLHVILPIPDSIGDTNSANWDASGLSPIETAAIKSARGGIAVLNNPGDAMKAGTDFLRDNLLSTMQKGTVQQAVVAGLVGGAVRNVLGGGGQFVERGAGITFNQNIEVLFQGLNLRGPFDFSFDMVARSEKEAMEIKEIIRSFKKYSAVKKTTDFGAAEGLFLKAPHVFRIRYMSGGKSHPFLNKFKICALESMNVNYAASGTYATYADGTPVHIQLGLSFQELTPIYYEDYLTQDEPEGQPKGSDDGIGVGY